MKATVCVNTNDIDFGEMEITIMSENDPQIKTVILIDATLTELKEICLVFSNRSNIDKRFNAWITLPAAGGNIKIFSC